MEADQFEVTFADLVKLTGHTYRTIRKKIDGIAPIREDKKSSYFSLKEVLPAIYTENGNEREQVTIEEIKARTRNWNITADRGEIKKHLEEGRVYLVEEVHSTLADMLTAFKIKLESVPSRIAAIDSTDYFLRMQQAEKIIDEALMEINEHAIRQCAQGDLESKQTDSEANA